MSKRGNARPSMPGNWMSIKIRSGANVWPPPRGSTLMIENVGNLVCPAHGHQHAAQTAHEAGA